MAAVTKRSLLDMKVSNSLSKGIDAEAYRAVVLGLPHHLTEDDIDDKLAQEAQDFGLIPTQVSSDIEAITSSFSATAFSSDLNTQSSIISRSTDPTSCSSSDRRPITQSSYLSEKSPPHSNAPSLLSDFEKKRDSGFRKGFRKMTGFRKRRSVVMASSTLTSINSDMANTTNSDRMSIKSDLKSPASVKSSKSSWSSPPSATKSSYEQPMPADSDTLKSGFDCKEILDLHATQLDERSRFLEYQRTTLTKLRAQHESAKQQKTEYHRRLVCESTARNDRAVEDLEGRQLEEELKLVKEFEIEKRTVMIRLRHMEAYCRNPTPPPTPIDPSSGRPSQEHQLPERRVTDKDYHSLAQQYRERDVMDTLHASRINVLRGKQKKAVENFMLKKEREIEAMETMHMKEIASMEREFAKEEDGIRLDFGSKRARLESRWRLQALIERSKVEKNTGMKYHPLPDVMAIEDLKVHVAPW